jgi:SMI1 / KNR4 family (SUKH-1)
MTKLKSNFFIQPAKGFDEHSQGRTESQLADYEAKAGFKLPASYRQIMAIQNGGSIRYEKIAGVEDFTFYGGFSEMRPDSVYYISNFKDYILCTCAEDELAAVQKELAPFHPERLILFAGLDGHSAAYFDYGYRQNEAVENPSIVFIGDDGDDFLHFSVIGPQFASFDAFLESLSLDTESDDATYLGIVSSNNFDATMQLLKENLGLQLTTYLDDDRYGHYNFDVWHSAHVPLALDEETMQLYAKQNDTTLEQMQDWTISEGKTRNIYSIFSPNQHRAGTYLYQDNPELTVVIEIKKSWFPMQKTIAGLVERLRQLPTILDVVMLP